MNDYAHLKEKHREKRDGFSQALSLRVHRALSWLDRAEREDADDDAKFIFLWIAFNAAYAQDVEGIEEFSEQEKLGSFVERLVEADGSKRLYKLLWSQFAGPVRTLIDNKYVYQPFWENLRGKPAAVNWEESFEKAKGAAHACLAHQNVAKLLQIVLSRLYTLRNQLVHGLATWQGAANRDQVRDGAAIMASLVPLMIDLMMDDPRPIWGEACYPVVE
jgi:hypothetical protein